MTEKAILYHNPRCSKSRTALKHLQGSNIEFVTVEYLKTPADKESLKNLSEQLQLKPRDMMRRGESLYKELNLDDNSHSDDQLLDAIVEHPILLERPIVSYKGEAAIGRPLDNIIELLDE